MTYEQFKTAITKQLEEMIPRSASLHTQAVQKNNQVSLDSIAILYDNINITPSIYLNYYYDDYRTGKSISDLAIQILNLLRKYQPNDNFDLSFFNDFHSVQKRIVFKLVNYYKNKDMLRTIPHIPYLDLAIVFMCYLDTSLCDNGTILITNSHMDLWDISVQELYEASIHNTPQLLPEEFLTMEEMIQSIMDNSDVSLPLASSNEASGMYILSNEAKLFGASCLLYQDLLHSIAQEFHSCLYILPSSIHEVIIIPTQTRSSLTDLTQMVREVNETQLSEEDILSDHAYYYDLDKQALFAS